MTVNVLRYIPLLLVFICSSCSLSKIKYQREYAKAWKEVVKSEAWQNALRTPNVVVSQVDYVSSDDEIILDTSTPITNTAFSKKYNSLVSRAYFKIIAEAEKADTRLKENMEYWQNKAIVNEIDKDLKRNIEVAQRKYDAHRSMLEGLRSWNIFTEERTADLEAFKSENKEELLLMFSNGEADQNMVNFLVYKLADLYH